MSSFINKQGTDLTGHQGPQGGAGPTGPTGATGDAGSDGAAGAAGEARGGTVVMTKGILAVRVAARPGAARATCCRNRIIHVKMVARSLPKWHGATSARVARDVGFNGGFAAHAHIRRQHERKVVHVRHHEVPRGPRGDGQAACSSNMRRERFKGLHARE